jgi:hypothetical protein
MELVMVVAAVVTGVEVEDASGLQWRLPALQSTCAQVPVAVAQIETCSSSISSSRWYSTYGGMVSPLSSSLNQNLV